MHVFLTGGTGFIGGAVVKKLVSIGHNVRALVRRGADTRQLDGLPVERVLGHLGDLDSLREGMQGCDWVFHVAALYSYWGHPWEDFFQANVEGTRQVFQAAQEQAVKRVIYTSSIAVLGPPEQGETCDEQTPSTLADMIGYYKRSKFLAEEVAQDYVQKGLPVVIVNPSAPIGVGDLKPTPTGKIIVDFLNGRMPAYVHSRQNMVDVEDVASGHLLAAERGKVGQRYILGGQNLTFKQFLDQLAEVSGMPQVRLRLPYGFILAFSYIDYTLGRLLPRYTPSATPETVRLSRGHMYFDSGKAKRELGYSPGPVKDALRKAVAWYRTNGYAK